MALRSATRWIVIAGIVALAGGCATFKGAVGAVQQWMEGADTGLRKRVVVARTRCGAGLEQWVCALVGQQLARALKREGSVVVMRWETVIRGDLRLWDPEALSLMRQAGAVAVVQPEVSGVVLTQELKGIYGFREMHPLVVLELNMVLRDAQNASVLAQKLLRASQEITQVQAAAIRDGKAPPQRVLRLLVARAVAKARAWVARAMARVPWKGYVLKAEGSRVLITAGRDTGLGVGSELVAYSRGEPIRTGSGRVVHLPGKRLGRIVITKLMSRSAWAKVVEGKVGVGAVVRTH